MIEGKWGGWELSFLYQVELIGNDYAGTAL